MNYVQDIPSNYRYIREHGEIWMGISFDELFSTFGEVSSREVTRVSPPTSNYINEVISSGPYSNDYVFTPVALD